ncbi:hypothetical protein BAE44_0017160 [Dichanthelium oligosanthes]|uniref:KIB1-4 beta-propeller domain-containing protein n=1 Tax=Dichanthelium oligosanthes TaxID=888268 RepID=A0A1E5V9N7_9POAL|nr:hypothetical protein BAE44_0017160 [Dichanthelium oligosanthes]
MHLSFARVGDTKWTLLHLEHCHGYRDITYNDNDRLFYAVAYGGEVHMIDLNSTSPALLFRDNMNIWTTRYVIRAPWGDLLQILRQYGEPPPTTLSDLDEEEDEYQSNSLVHASLVMNFCCRENTFAVLEGVSIQ